MSLIKLVCFDMWDTLCRGGGRKQIEEIQSSLHANQIANKKFLKQVEFSLMTKPWSLKKGMLDLVAKLELPKKDVLIKKAVNVWMSYVKSLKPFPESTSVLKQIKKSGINLTLVSNTDLTSISIKLPALGWDKYFDKIFLSAELGVLKPDKEIFRGIENHFKIPKNQVLFVDDSLYHGVYPAKKFGWQTLWINRGQPNNYKNQIGNLKEVYKFL